MPNHVINEVVFTGMTPNQYADIKRLCCDQTGKIDFEILLPMPLNIWQGSVGSNHQAAFKAGNGLDWSTVNWGTKWNAYDQLAPKYDGDKVTLTFQTAWTTPRGWLCALFNASKLSFEVRWLSEGGWKGHVETFKYEPNNKFSRLEWVDKEIEEGTDLHKHLHKLLWGVEQFEEEDEDAIHLTPEQGGEQ